MQRAISANAKTVALWLLESGLDVNHKDRQGLGGLSIAARTGRLWAVELLLRRGGDLAETDGQGMTPLHHAMLSNSADARHVARALLEAGANPNQENLRGASPLAWLQGGGYDEFESAFRPDADLA